MICMPQVILLIGIKRIYNRKTTDTPRLLDDAEQQRQIEARQAEIAEYRAQREEVEARRELDRQQRNLAKVKQLELFEEMQV